MQAFSEISSVRQTARLFGHNFPVGKNTICDVLAHNIEAAMDRQDLSGNALAKRAGVSQTHLAKVLRGEADLSTTKLAEIAAGLGMHPWELLVDSEAVRERVIRRALQPEPQAESPRRANRR